MKYNLVYICPCCGKESVVFQTNKRVESFPVLLGSRGALGFCCERCNKEAVVELKEVER